MRNCLIFLAAITLTACGQKSDSSRGTLSPPETNENAASPVTVSNVIVTTQTSGNLTVDARSDATTFENRSDQANTFVFKAHGEWSFAPGAGPLGPSGASSPAPKNFLLPGANSFELVAKRGDGTYTRVGDSTELTLNPHEIISFAMNDIIGGLPDNRGSLTIDWSKK
jgi:hypothetical protein